MPVPKTKSLIFISEDHVFGIEEHLCVCPGHSCANRNLGMSSLNVYLYGKKKGGVAKIFLKLCSLLDSSVKMKTQHISSR